MENERQLWKNRSRVRAAIILKDYPEGIISRKHMRSFSKKGFRQYLSASLYRYFDNVSELLYYAELRILTGYIDRLNEAEKSWKNMWQVYVGVWVCYAKESFHNP